MTIILVDGDSKDKTVQIASNILSKSNINFKIYSDSGQGLGAARQIVIDRAKSDYVIFVDGDVVLTKDFVKKQVAFMERNPKVGGAVGKYEYMNGSFVASLHNLYQTSTFDSYVGNDATIYRLNAVREVGGFDKNISGACEDIDLINRLEANGWIFAVNKEAGFYHYCRETFQELWSEHVWYGKGGCYLIKKKGQKISWRQSPFIVFAGGVKLALKAYKIMKKKASFFLPLILLFENLAWWFGFIKAYLNK